MIVVLTTTPPAGLRDLLDAAFDDFSDDDWDHGLGGVHAAVLDHDELVAHAAVVPRSIDAGGRTFPDAGYVENVATRPDRQGAGAGTAAMATIGEVLHERHELGVLSTSSHAFYERLGWERWRGPSSVRLPDGSLVRTADEDDGIMVLRFGASATLDLDGPIACDARTGDDW